MEELVKLFLISSLLASAMICIVLLIRKAFSKKVSTVVMLILWAFVLVRLCIPFTFDSPVHMSELLPQQPVSAVAQSMQAAPVAQPSALPVGDQAGSPYANTQTANLDTTQTALERDFGKTLQGFLQSISVWGALAVIWLAGMTVTLALFIRKAVLFRKKLAFCKPVCEPAILETVQYHKESAGVKREILVLACDFVAVPAVCGFFRPCILIPAQFIRQMDDASMNAILLHEVCHVLCCDILVNYIWLAAKALHWFNPLVWIAFSRFGDDVELCRDRMATARLHADGTLVYSQSLVEAARISRKNAETAPIFTTSLFESRGKLKERVSRLMKPRKQSRVSVTVCALLAAVMLVTCFTTACQPTPEKPFVISKQSSPVQEAAKVTGSQAAQELASNKKVIKDQIEKLGGHLQMEFKPNEKVKINVDADIAVPEYSHFPLVRVKPENLTKEQFDIWIKLLTGGKPVYYEDIKFPRSKEEINGALAELKVYAVNKNLPDYIKSNIDYQIDKLKEQYNEAINKADEKPYDGTLVKAENNKYYSTITQLKCYTGKGIAAQIGLWQTMNQNQSQMSFYGDSYGSAYNTFEPFAGSDAQKIKMSYQEAKTKAEDMVRTLDGEDTNLVLYESDIAYQIGTFTNYTKETSPQAYAFRFGRSYDGVPVKLVNYLWGTEGVDYTNRVAPESFFVVINDEGINYAYWQEKTKTVEKVSDDVPLKDFNSIKDIFEQQCKQKFTWAPRNDAIVGDDQSVTLHVKRVELNMMAIPEKDNLENYITVPVWDFIGDMKYNKQVSTQDGYPPDEPKNVSIVTINAMDGSIINREQGY